MDKFSLVDEDIVKAAIDAYEVQKLVEPDSDGIKTALRAALTKYEQRVQERIARAVLAYSEALQNRTGALKDDPGPQALEEFAGSLLMEIPGDDYVYEPEAGDVIEIALVGQLQLEEDVCSNCGFDHGSKEWGLTDRHTGNQYWFSDRDFTNARVRVVMRGTDFDGVPIDMT